MHEVLPEFSYNLPNGNLVLAKAMQGKDRCQNCSFRNNGTACAEPKPTETLQRNCADVGFYWNIRQKRTEIMFKFHSYLTPDQCAARGLVDKITNPAYYANLLEKAKASPKCCNCENPVWVLADSEMCFSCTTLSTDASDDYEVSDVEGQEPLLAYMAQYGQADFTDEIQNADIITQNVNSAYLRRSHTPSLRLSSVEALGLVKRVSDDKPKTRILISDRSAREANFEARSLNLKHDEYEYIPEDDSDGRRTRALRGKCGYSSVQLVGYFSERERERLTRPATQQ